VLRWSAAADRARLQARRASERTAAASSAAMAVRFEREAEIHLKAALCHELAAVALFASDEAVTRSHMPVFAISHWGKGNS
jgi:hypothetical protein